MTIIDISRVLSERTSVWPGDRSIELSWTMSQDKGASVNVGAVCMSLHAGTHVDAPSHFHPNADTVDQLPLGAFVGPALVIDIGDATAIHPRHLEAYETPLQPRLLIRSTCSDVPATEWPAPSPYITPEAVAWLGSRNVVLLGTDAPSVDPQDSSTLPAHHALREHEISILEHLDLSAVEPGPYQLVALPLRLSGMDASPVRAVLIENG